MVTRAILLSCRNGARAISTFRAPTSKASTLRESAFCGTRSLKMGSQFGRRGGATIGGTAQRRLLSTQAKEGAASDTGGGGAGLGGVVVFGFVGAIIGWFYRGHRATKARVALIEDLCDVRPLAPEEVNEVREVNGATEESFRKAIKSLKLDLAPGSKSRPQEFFAGVASALGKKLFGRIASI